MRSELHRVLADVVSARINLDALCSAILLEYRTGYRPTYRGHEIGPEQIETLEKVRISLDLTFHLLKMLQWPETGASRAEDIAALPLDTVRLFAHLSPPAETPALTPSDTPSNTPELTR